MWCVFFYAWQPAGPVCCYLPESHSSLAENTKCSQPMTFQMLVVFVSESSECVFVLRIYVSFLVFLIFQYYCLSVVSHTFLSIQFWFISLSIFHMKCFLTNHLPASLYHTHLFPVFRQFQVFCFICISEHCRSNICCLVSIVFLSTTVLLCVACFNCISHTAFLLFVATWHLSALPKLSTGICSTCSFFRTVPSSHICFPPLTTSE